MRVAGFRVRERDAEDRGRPVLFRGGCPVVIGDERESHIFRQVALMEMLRTGNDAVHWLSGWRFQGQSLCTEKTARAQVMHERQVSDD